MGNRSARAWCVADGGRESRSRPRRRRRWRLEGRFEPGAGSAWRLPSVSTGPLRCPQPAMDIACPLRRTLQGDVAARRHLAAELFLMSADRCGAQPIRAGLCIWFAVVRSEPPLYPRAGLRKRQRAQPPIRPLRCLSRKPGRFCSHQSLLRPVASHKPVPHIACKRGNRVIQEYGNSSSAAPSIFIRSAQTLHAVRQSSAFEPVSLSPRSARPVLSVKSACGYAFACPLPCPRGRLSSNSGAT